MPTLDSNVSLQRYAWTATDNRQDLMTTLQQHIHKAWAYLEEQMQPDVFHIKDAVQAVC